MILESFERTKLMFFHQFSKFYLEYLFVGYKNCALNRDLMMNFDDHIGVIRSSARLNYDEWKHTFLFCNNFHKTCVNLHLGTTEVVDGYAEIGFSVWTTGDVAFTVFERSCLDANLITDLEVVFFKSHF